MNKNTLLLAGRPVRNLTLAVMAVISLSACTQQKLAQTQTELTGARECLVKQQEQNQIIAQQQATLVEQLQKVQTQLSVQQTLLEEQPKVIHAPAQPKMDCPPPPPPEKFLSSQPPLSDKQIVGLREQALIAGLNFVMQARISTSVANSVIDARNIQMFERNSEEWVRFTIYNPETKEPHVLERKRLRFQTVQTATSTNPDRRPVVEIRFTIGKLSQRGEFVLADRSDSEFPMLIGRNLLRDVMLVDVSGNYLAPLQRAEDAAPKN
uniref:ATP-dependent zinc protease family protein n=1 Tax=Cellvibrio fontiphilus TaxID=1815559 RepID=UPI002B4BA9E3|nr:RimK/LysX family protein [Cellvibrio fontiphilus]